MSSFLLLGAGTDAGAGGANPFALDGTPTNQSSNTQAQAASWSLPAFSTTYGNDFVFIAAECNGGPFVGVPTGGGLTFTLVVQDISSGASLPIALWMAKAASPLSGAVFTVTQTSSAFFNSWVFAFSGADYSGTNFDANSPWNGATSLSITTANANDIVICAARSHGIDTGFTDIATDAFFMGAEYKLFSATQSALSLSMGGANPASMVACAIRKAP